MKTSALFLTALCSGTLLLGSCNQDKSAAGTTVTTAPPAGDMAGMDPSAMGHGRAAGASPMLAAMNDMMAKMHGMKPKGNTDHDFAHHMIEHHRGAVAMADIELRDGQDAMLRQMAEKIKADQQREIAQMEPIAERLDAAPTNYQPQNPNDPFTTRMKASMDGMMQNMPQETGNVDQDFVGMMIPHHQSAVDMAKAEVAHGRDTKLMEMAQQMIDAQQQEIQQFKAWQAKHPAQH